MGGNKKTVFSAKFVFSIDKVFMPVVGHSSDSQDDYFQIIHRDRAWLAYFARFMLERFLHFYALYRWKYRL